MPPRYCVLDDLAGGLPTAFRAAEREELEPTFRRLREKHPDAEMKWFSRGKLWSSPDEALRPARTEVPERRSSAGRGRDWRPGGQHRDPRQPYKDAKKARNLDRRKDKFARKHGDAGADRPDRAERPAPPERPAAVDRAARPDRPAAPRAQGKWQDRAPRDKPHGDKLFPRDSDRARRDTGGLPTGPAGARGNAPRDSRFPRDGERHARRDTSGLPTGPAGARSNAPRDTRFPRDNAARGAAIGRRDAPPGGKPDWRKPAGAHGKGAGRPRDDGGTRSRASADRPDARPRSQAPKDDWRPAPRPSADRDHDRGRAGLPTGPAARDRGRAGLPTGDAARDRSAGFTSDWRKPSSAPRPPRDESRPAKPFREGRHAPRPVTGERSGSGKPDWRDRPRAPKGDGPRADWRARGQQTKPHGDRFDAHVPRDRRPDSRGPAPRNDGNRPGGGGAPRATWPRDNQRRTGAPPDKPHGDPLRPGGRRFDRKEHPRNQGVAEPQPPPRPRGPNREPKPSEKPEPGAPPRPSEPVIPPPGPPERGRLRKPRRDR